jgi:hypothetical protein
MILIRDGGAGFAEVVEYDPDEPRFELYRRDLTRGELEKIVIQAMSLLLDDWSDQDG